MKLKRKMNILIIGIKRNHIGMLDKQYKSIFFTFEIMNYEIEEDNYLYTKVFSYTCKINSYISSNFVVAFENGLKYIWKKSMRGKIFNFPSGRIGSSSNGVRPPREAHGVIKWNFFLFLFSKCCSTKKLFGLLN